MIDILFIADFFADQVNGGGELNNQVLIDSLSNKGYNVGCANSHIVDLDFLNREKARKYIVSNFINLPAESKDFIQENLQYTIYEHDHKYLKNRNPAKYENYKAPESEIINKRFYENAELIYCQSNFHSGIVKKNLNLDNIVSVSGNLWSDDSLEFMREMSLKSKKDVCSIMDSATSHKNTEGALKYCHKKGYSYELIPSCPPKQFLSRISNNDRFIFFPLTPETLSRIVVEARMMGLKTITNKRIGAVTEDWFSLKGSNLVDFMYEKKNEIIEKVEEFVNE
jgi:hypothetical protein